MVNKSTVKESCQKPSNRKVLARMFLTHICSLISCNKCPIVNNRRLCKEGVLRRWKSKSPLERLKIYRGDAP